MQSQFEIRLFADTEWNATDDTYRRVVRVVLKLYQIPHAWVTDDASRMGRLVGNSSDVQTPPSTFRRNVW